MKKIGEKEYPYLLFREGQKVKTEYLKMNELELKELNFKIAQRKKYEKALREIKKDYNIIRRVIKK